MKKYHWRMISVVVFLWTICCWILSRVSLAQLSSLFCVCVVSMFFRQKRITKCVADIDECSTGINDCHVKASCTNTHGSFTCECQLGYAGNGSFCEGEIVYVASAQHVKVRCYLWFIGHTYSCVNGPSVVSSAVCQWPICRCIISRESLAHLSLHH